MKRILSIGLLSFGVTLYGAALSACSQEEPAHQDTKEAKSEAAPEAPVRHAVAGPGVLDEGFDGTVDLETFKARCDASVQRLQDQYDAFVEIQEPYTIESVVRPYDDMGEGPGENARWFYFMASVHPDAEFRDVANACYQRFAAIGSEIGLDRRVYDRLKGVDLSSADPVLKRYVEDQVRDFETSGVNKDDETREKIKTLIQDSIDTSREFERNIREDVRVVEITDPALLDGLPEDYIENHQPDEEGIIRLTTAYPDFFPVMTYAHSDQLRQDMRLAYGNRAYPQNEAVLRRLLEKRYEMAQILDYETYAALSMEDRMIGSVDKAQEFVDEISSVVKPPAVREKARLLERYREIDPDAEQVMPWQRSYISNIIRKEDYEVDSSEVREYFQYDLVRDGIFQLIEDLFELDIRPWETEVWDPSVEAFEVYDGGDLIGRFYIDMHPRDGKYSHAAHMALRIGVVGRQLPLSALMCNFPGGDGTAGLMEHGQVRTFLHEFGHLIHNMLSGTQEWSGISGMSMERDFVEAPSQMLEEWMWDYDTIAKFARNQDGETIPRELFDKMVAARNFGFASGTAGQTFLAAMSLSFYDRDPAGIDFDALNRELYAKYSVYDYVGGTHGYANFGHLAGYSSNYYTYQWSLAIAADLLSEFEKNGLRDKETARRYRDLVLGAAGSKPAEEFIADFLGRPWSLDAYRKQLEEAASQG